MSDPTAAERARRYRARRRERDVTERHGGAELVAVLAQLVERVEELAELVRAGYPPSAVTVDKRDDFARHAVRRDVTERHASESARAGDARTGTAPGSYGAEGAVAIPDLSSRVTDPGVDPRGRILEALAGRSPHSVAAIADAIGLSSRDAAAELVALAGLGRVRRVGAILPGDFDRWELVTGPAPDAAGESISCSSYREHQLAHRRDPASGRFRCYICDPEGRPAEPVAEYAPAPPA